MLFFLASCHSKVDSYGVYSVYKKLDDTSINILVVDTQENGYSYRSNINIDLPSLSNYSQFMVDKNKAYGKYEMDGDCKLIPIAEVDIETFQVLNNSIYAKDKNHVYECRNGIIEKADVNSFVVDNNGVGRDKDNEYFWDKVVRDTTIIERNH